MSVTVCLPLFGGAAHELEERVGGKELRDLAEALRERLLAAADTLDRLRADGWTAQLGAFDLILSHPRVAGRAQAEERLRAAGVDPAALMIVEDVEEEEEAEGG